MLLSWHRCGTELPLTFTRSNCARASQAIATDYYDTLYDMHTITFFPPPPESRSRRGAASVVCMTIYMPWRVILQRHNAASRHQPWLESRNCVVTDISLHLWHLLFFFIVFSERFSYFVLHVVVLQLWAQCSENTHTWFLVIAPSFVAKREREKCTTKVNWQFYILLLLLQMYFIYQYL